MLERKIVILLMEIGRLACHDTVNWAPAVGDNTAVNCIATAYIPAPVQKDMPTNEKGFSLV